MSRQYSFIDDSTTSGTNTINTIIDGNGYTDFGTTVSSSIIIDNLEVGISTFVGNIKADKSLQISENLNVSGIVSVTGTIRDSNGTVGAAGSVLSSNGSGQIWVAADDGNTANASNVGTNANSANATNYVAFVGSTSGNNPVRINTSLKYNPSSNKLSTGEIELNNIVGTAVSIAGIVTATTFTKTGGTSSQFLKADGSVDSTTYSASEIPSGSVMLFYQGSAPTGWTKVTTQNNKALRVVSGTGGGTGGTNNFTTVFTNQSLSVSGTASGDTNSVNSGSVSISGNCGGTQSIYTNTTQNTLSIAQLAAHTHAYDVPRGTSGGQFGFVDSLNSGSSGTPNVASTGSGSAHGHAIIGFVINGSNFTFSGSGSPSNHSHTFSDTVSSSGSLDMRVQYIDLIICSKD